MKRNGDRIIALKLVMDGETFNVISAYTTQVGLGEQDKFKFREDLENLIQENGLSIPSVKMVFLGGDPNCHMGREAREYKGYHEGYNFGEVNGEGKHS